MRWQALRRRLGQPPFEEAPPSPPLISLTRDAFVSYSRRDVAFIDELEQKVTALQGTLWIDRHDIPPGSPFWTDIKRGIEESRNFIFLLTEHSVASPHCLFELRHAVSRGKRLIPLRPGAQACGAPSPSELAHIQDFVWDVQRPADENSRQLLKLLRTEPQFVEQHGELLRRALRWRRAGNAPDELLPRKLLRGAENWLRDAAVLSSPETSPSRPRATRLLQRYVRESRRRFNRRLRLAVVSVLLSLMFLASGWGWVTSTPYQFLQIERETPNLVALALNDPGGPPDEVLEGFVAALAAHGNLKEAIDAAQHWRGPAEKASALARIVETLSRAGALREARQVRSLIDKSPSGIMSLGAPAEVLAAASEASFAVEDRESADQELRSAIKLAREIPAEGGKSGALKMRDPVFARILAAHVRQRRIDEALNGLSWMGDPDRRESVRIHLVTIAADLWTRQDILLLAQAIQDADERALALGNAARGVRSRGLEADAVALEDAAFQAVQGSQGPLALVQVGRLLVARKPALAEQAFMAARELARQQKKVDERLMVAVGFTELGRQEEAAVDIREALALMDSEGYEHQRLLDALVRVGQPGLARKLAGTSPFDLLQLVRTLAELGRLDEAAGLAPSIAGEVEQSSAFYELAHAYTSRREYRQARSYALRCRPTERMKAYTEMLRVHSPR
ncbi:toll/interleukin-1 receptor domain-containing protein [Pyxidicoccus parkwayensis]|uniref:Toll/interleukin-1 receptor domain-containing protein n=1 Tax=Pyxidicoccus parkwayensis TaxID=2813578 RepID=A0ABX7NKW8_9BACT|nr:toll/interleukin-1 receptor domain-containing protein [Pyxidicoccus parkwaysis]QSQ19063.1 toll/interleukin-1 receptor domain-containing protein [Pyxidicoccus parkwaysis]